MAKNRECSAAHQTIVTGFGVEEGRCPIQCWIASQFERGRSPIASRFNRDKKVIDSGLRWFLLDNELSTCSMV